MRKLLVVSGHPDLENSVANKEILRILKEKLPNAEFDVLSELYPDFKIDVAREQEKLRAADVVVLEFPLFWYSSPALLHQWVEQVFVRGFSHGREGDKLKGKTLVLSFTAGAPTEYYTKEVSGYDLEAFLPPFKCCAALCGMNWGGHVFSGSLSYADRGDEAKIARMKQIADEHAEKLLALLSNLK